VKRLFHATVAATMLLSATVFLSLAFAAGASGMRVTGTMLGPTPEQAAQVGEAVSLGNYIVAASAAYAQLSDCASCCGALDLPTHRCPACRTTAAVMRQLVARTRHVQAELARLDVPASATKAHGELVEAAAVLHISGDYMADRVSHDPLSLIVSTRTMEGTRRVSPPAWLTSPHVVRDARMAAYTRLHPAPMYRTQHLRAIEITTGPDPAICDAPGEQAQAYLAKWRDEIQRLARRAGLGIAAATLPSAYDSAPCATE
jgi:hypothetical protein